jgi:hypothetical protein
LVTNIPLALLLVVVIRRKILLKKKLCSCKTEMNRRQKGRDQGRGCPVLSLHGVLGEVKRERIERAEVEPGRSRLEECQIPDF